MDEVEKIIQELDEVHKLEELQAEHTVKFLNEETVEEIGQYLKDGETYITAHELWKRQ